MKISVRNMVKIYSISNIIVDKMYNIINDENINYIMSYNNKIIISSLIIIVFQIINPNYYYMFKNIYKKQKKIVSIYNTFYPNQNIDKYIDFIGLLFIFIFFREVKNAI